MKKGTKELVNKDAILVMAILHGEESVGTQGTVEEQLLHAVGLCEKAYYQQLRYEAALTCRTFSGVNNSDRAEELMRKYFRTLKQAVRKILFLNTVCRTLTGQYFITELIERDSLPQCDQLVEEFSNLQQYVRDYLLQV